MRSLELPDITSCPVELKLLSHSKRIFLAFPMGNIEYEEERANRKTSSSTPRREPLKTSSAQIQIAQVVSLKSHCSSLVDLDRLEAFE